MISKTLLFLSNLLHTSRIDFLCLKDHTFTIYVENVPSFKVRHDFFENSFSPSTVIEWNKLDKNIRKSESLNIFKKSILKFIRPSQNMSL